MIIDNKTYWKVREAIHILWNYGIISDKVRDNFVREINLVERKEKSSIKLNKKLSEIED